jgi:hypothetical protein
MAKNRFYTVLIVPEKTSQVKHLVFPTWAMRGIAFGLAMCILLAGVMIFDYAYVMSQIGENKQLKLENRRLRQQVQLFHRLMEPHTLLGPLTELETISVFILVLLLHLMKQD